MGKIHEPTITFPPKKGKILGKKKPIASTRPKQFAKVYPVTTCFKATFQMKKPCCFKIRRSLHKLIITPCHTDAHKHTHTHT